MRRFNSGCYWVVLYVSADRCLSRSITFGCPSSPQAVIMPRIDHEAFLRVMRVQSAGTNVYVTSVYIEEYFTKFKPPTDQMKVAC
jgi:hypothetical protein